jgi:hypothetical protein
MGHFKIFLFFSRVFLSILLNNGLYFDIVKYKFGIKILGFLWNILKKFKTFKLILIFKKYKKK